MPSYKVAADATVAGLYTSDGQQQANGHLALLVSHVSQSPDEHDFGHAYSMHTLV